jgi:hypothetical protein
MAALTLAALLGAAGGAACGSSSPGITEDASKQLELQVAAVRNAAAARDRPGAERALADLRRSVEDLRHEISAERRSKVLDAAATVEARLQSIPTTTTTTTTTPPRPSPKGDKGGEKERNGGKGKNGGD